MALKGTRRNANNCCPRRDTFCDTSSSPDYSIVFNDQRMLTGAIDNNGPRPNVHSFAYMDPS